MLNLGGSNPAVCRPGASSFVDRDAAVTARGAVEVVAGACGDAVVKSIHKRRRDVLCRRRGGAGEERRFDIAVLCKARLGV